MKHHSLSKVLKRLACVLAALVIALAVAVFALWHNELATLSSLKKLSDRKIPLIYYLIPTFYFLFYFSDK